MKISRLPIPAESLGLLSAHERGDVDSYTLHVFCQRAFEIREEAEEVQRCIEGCERGCVRDERYPMYDAHYYDLLSEKEALEGELKASFLDIFGPEKGIRYIH